MKAIGKTAGLMIVVLALATPALANVCGNPYVGNVSSTFAFKNKLTGSSERYTISVDKVTANSFELQFRYPDVSFTWPFTCTPAGVTSPRFGLGRVAGPNRSVTYQVTSSSGVVIASPDRWKVGGTWTYANQGTAAASGQNYTFKNEMTFRVVAKERVEVPAGAFDALKVVLTNKGEFGASGYTQPINSSIDQWYAPGVGLVRQEDRAGSHELVEYKR